MNGENILRSILDALIQIEYAGERMYKLMSENTDDPELTDMFIKLAIQECEHKDIFENYKNTMSLNIEVDVIKLEHLNRLVNDSTQSLSSKHVPETMTEAIHRSIQFEKDTIRFLEEMRLLIDPKFHSEIGILIEEEMTHLYCLYDRI